MLKRKCKEVEWRSIEYVPPLGRYGIKCMMITYSSVECKKEAIKEFKKFGCTTRESKKHPQTVLVCTPTLEALRKIKEAVRAKEATVAYV